MLVMPEPPAETIDVVAACIRRHDFAMTPVLRELLGSTLFFSEAARGSVIKSPADLVLGSLRTLECSANLQSAVQMMAQLGQNLFEPPTVKGWEGNRLWIHSSAMLLRANFAAELTTGSRFGAIADPQQVAASRGASTPGDAVAVYADLLLQRDVPEVVAEIGRRIAPAGGSTDAKLRSAIYALMTMPEYQLM
jgi:uncharacterized protein (DUF1800 family)